MLINSGLKHQSLEKVIISKEPENMENDKIDSLISGFLKIPSIYIEPTFFQITGYPHLENVCSNILKFFFRVDAEHKLYDLFITTLLQIIGNGKYNDRKFNSLQVVREARTDNGRGRIDLLIQADDILICIENKIFAKLYNDLSEYNKYIKQHNANEIIKVVLSLNKIKDINEIKMMNDNGFINITYTVFLNNIKNNLSKYIIGCNRRYLNQLIDFIESINNLQGGGIMMNKEILKYCYENKEEISEFLTKYEYEQKVLNEKIKAMSEMTIYDDPNIRKWNYTYMLRNIDFLIIDISLKRDIIRIHVSAEPIGCKIHIEAYGTPKKQKKIILQKLNIYQDIKYAECTINILDRLLYKEYKSDEDNDNIVKDLQVLIKNILSSKIE